MQHLARVLIENAKGLYITRVRAHVPVRVRVRDACPCACIRVRAHYACAIPTTARTGPSYLSAPALSACAPSETPPSSHMRPERHLEATRRRVYALTRQIVPSTPFKPLAGDSGGGCVPAGCVCTRSRGLTRLLTRARTKTAHLCVRTRDACVCAPVRVCLRACLRVRVICIHFPAILNKPFVYTNSLSVYTRKIALSW